MIAIIDYGVGNLRSVQKAFEFIGVEAVATSNPDTIKNADKVVLPGVGAFADAMQRLEKSGLLQLVYESAENKPFLGICLGMQLLFDESEEGGKIKGLGILKGKIKKIPPANGLKIPHMGWNSLKLQGKSHLFKHIKDESYVYFVHSYYLDAQDKTIVKGTTEYGREIDVAVEKGNIFATQFHPEKSGTVGLQILRNFSAYTGEENQ